MRITKYIICLLVALLGFAGTSMAQNKPFLVVLDAGHGGHDAGAVGRPTTNREKDINLAITLKVGELLKQNCPDVKVLYTRSTDVFVTLGGRADIANKAKADLFVSIHTNAIERSADRLPMGVQAYTLCLRTASTNLEVEKRENSVIQLEADGAQRYSFMNPNSPESEIMFEMMQDRDMKESVNFAKMAQEEMVKTGGRKDKGVLQANLAVLRLTYMPSVLLEVGYISTPEEETFLMSDEGRTVMAKCIYNAIARYKTQHTGRMSNLEKVDSKAIQKQLAEKAKDESKENKESQPNSSVNKPENSPASVQQPTNVNELAKASANTTQTAQTTQAQSNQGVSLASVAGNNKPIFKIQLFVSQKKMIPGSTQLKGLTADSYKEGIQYKYTYGSTTDYNEIYKMKKSISDKFPDAFIIAFKNGVKVNTNDAINEWKKNNKK